MEVDEPSEAPSQPRARVDHPLLVPEKVVATSVTAAR